MREGKGAGLLKVTLVLAFIMLAAAYVVAAWAMAGKPNEITQAPVLLGRPPRRGGSARRDAGP